MEKSYFCSIMQKCVKSWVNTSDVQLSVFTDTFTAWHSSVTYKNIYQFGSDDLTYQNEYIALRLKVTNPKFKVEEIMWWEQMIFKTL